MIVVVSDRSGFKDWPVYESPEHAGLEEGQVDESPQLEGLEEGRGVDGSPQFEG